MQTRLIHKDTMEEPPTEELLQDEQQQDQQQQQEQADKPMELDPQEPEPEEMEVWCLIVGMVGTAFPVIVQGTDRVWELQKTIKNEAVEIFGDFNAAQLRLYLAKNDAGHWLSAAEVQAIENGDARPAGPLLARGHLASMSPLVGILKGRDANSVHILVPAPSKSSEIEVEPDIAGKRKRSEQSFGDVETIGVSAEELKLLFDVLGQKRQAGPGFVSTQTLHEFLEGFGGFPSAYFVRKEELVLWGLVMRILSKREKRLVLVGSAGVGKSCFVMLISLYLALVEKKKVLVVRRLRAFSEASAVVYLDGGSASCIRKANLTAAKIASLPDRNEFQDAFVLVDGYTRKEVDRLFGLLPFQLLASSMENDVSLDDSSCSAVLPGWQYNDLCQYAESRPEHWKQSTGFGHEDQKTLTELVQAQYFYSGGSLRSFLKHCEDVKNGLDTVCGIVENAQTVDLELLHQAGLQVSESFDRVRRHYVLDPNDEDHYWQVCHWRTLVDCGYAFKRIGRFMDWDNLIGHQEFAQKARTGFLGAAYEECFHSALRHATKWCPVQMVNVVVNFDPTYSNQRYDRIEMHGQCVQREGSTEDECYTHISKLAPGTYWHPECVEFPFVDAVVVCEATLRGSGIKEKIVACISITVGEQKAFQPDLWRKLNEAIDENDSISTSIPRVFVIVGPDASTCKRVTLADAPAPDEFMVCCFDPLKFPRTPALPY